MARWLSESGASAVAGACAVTTSAFTSVRAGAVDAATTTANSRGRLMRRWPPLWTHLLAEVSGGLTAVGDLVLVNVLGEPTIRTRSVGVGVEPVMVARAQWSWLRHQRSS